MKVEWVGGPKDGLTFEVSDNTRSVMVPILDKHCINPKSIDDLVFHQAKVFLIFRDRWIAIHPSIKKWMYS